MDIPDILPDDPDQIVKLLEGIIYHVKWRDKIARQNAIWVTNMHLRINALEDRMREAGLSCDWSSERGFVDDTPKAEG